MHTKQKKKNREKIEALGIAVTQTEIFDYTS